MKVDRSQALAGRTRRTDLLLLLRGLPLAVRGRSRAYSRTARGRPTPTPTEPRGYLPALRFSALTRIYDPVVGLTTRERRFKELLVEQAAPAAGQRILDLGCGTGTLAIQVKRREPGAEVVGLDADPEMLGQAREKAEGRASS